MMMIVINLSTGYRFFGMRDSNFEGAKAKARHAERQFITSIVVCPKSAKEKLVNPKVDTTTQSVPDFKWNPPENCLRRAYDTSAMTISVVRPVKAEMISDIPMMNPVLSKNEIACFNTATLRGWSGLTDLMPLASFHASESINLQHPPS
jgi:hypothetical protein